MVHWTIVLREMSEYVLAEVLVYLRSTAYLSHAARNVDVRLCHVANLHAQWTAWLRLFTRSWCVVSVHQTSEIFIRTGGGHFVHMTMSLSTRLTISQTMTASRVCDYSVLLAYMFIPEHVYQFLLELVYIWQQRAQNIYWHIIFETMWNNFSISLAYNHRPANHICILMTVTITVRS